MLIGPKGEAYQTNKSARNHFFIFDAGGKKVDEQPLTNLGRIWQGTSKSFKLSPGNYNAHPAKGGTGRIPVKDLDKSRHSTSDGDIPFIMVSLSR